MLASCLDWRLQDPEEIDASASNGFAKECQCIFVDEEWNLKSLAIHSSLSHKMSSCDTPVEV